MYHIDCVTFGTRRIKKQKKKCKTKKAFRLEGHGGLEAFQTSAHLGGCVGKIYLACDIRAFRYRRTIIGRFMVSLPRIPVDPLCLFHMRSGW